MLLIDRSHLPSISLLSILRMVVVPVVIMLVFFILNLLSFFYCAFWFLLLDLVSFSNPSSLHVRYIQHADWINKWRVSSLLSLLCQPRVSLFYLDLYMGFLTCIWVSHGNNERFWDSHFSKGILHLHAIETSEGLSTINETLTDYGILTSSIETMHSWSLEFLYQYTSHCISLPSIHF